MEPMLWKKACRREERPCRRWSFLPAQSYKICPRMFAKSSSREWNINVYMHQFNVETSWGSRQPTMAIRSADENEQLHTGWIARHVSKLENSLTIWCIGWTQFVWRCFYLGAFRWVAFYFWYLNGFPSMMFHGNRGECLPHPAVLTAFALPSQVSFGDFSHRTPFLCLLNCPKHASYPSNVFALQQIYL